MENSLGSFVDKGVAEDGPEESGWTAYFEDLSSVSRGYSSSSGACAAASLVSDAASRAAWKATTANRLVACSSMAASSQIPRKLTFKKTRTREIFYDDSLEDTASSPVNSPKKMIMDMNPRKTDNSHMESPQGKGDGGDHYSELQQANDQRNDEMSTVKCSDLEKRGLCLVPLSMLVNYLG